MSWLNNSIHEDFSRARRKAFIAWLFSLFNREANQLVPLDELQTRLFIRGQHYRGHQTVPLANIVGSEGRHNDFDRQFAPRRDTTGSRWMSINQAHYDSIALPAVELYKVGEIYFVRDGHHRISVARQHGQLDIDAVVTELKVDVPLDPSLSIGDLPLKEEYSDFLEWTGLADLRPEQRIEFSESGGYLDLVRHINTHRYYMDLERSTPVTAAEAVADWYDNVYLPVVHALREQQTLRFFPGRSEADLYRWTMDHRWYLRERNGGADPGPLVAVADYARRFGRRLGLSALTERLARGVRSVIGPMAARNPS